jgi:hypothetical protein
LVNHLAEGNEAVKNALLDAKVHIIDLVDSETKLEKAN